MRLAENADPYGLRRHQLVNPKYPQPFGSCSLLLIESDRNLDSGSQTQGDIIHFGPDKSVSVKKGKF